MTPPAERQETADLRKEHDRRLKGLVLTALFVAGFLIGRMLWSRISLPFSNPWGVVGRLTRLQVNPLDDQVRFVMLVLLPAGMLLAACLVGGRRLRDFLLHGAASPALEEGPPLGKRYVLLTVLLCWMLLCVIGTGREGPPLRECFHPGESLGTAMSHEAGGVPYRDFVFVHGVFEDALQPTIGFALFGRSVSGARVFTNLMILAAHVLCSVYVVIMMGRRLGYACVVLLVLVFLRSLRDLGFHANVWVPDRDICTFTFLIAAFVAGRYVFDPERGGRRAFLVALFFYSFVPLASFAYSIDRGFFLTAAHVILTVLLLISFRKWRGHALASLGAMCLGYVCGVLLVGFLLRWHWRPFFEFAFLRIPRYKELMDGLPMPVSNPLVLGLLALMAANTFWLFHRLLTELHHSSGWTRGLRTFVEKYWVELPLLVVSLTFARHGLGRSDLVHVTRSGLPSCILSLIIVMRHHVPGWLKRIRLEKSFTVVVVTLVLVTGVILAWRAHSRDLWRSQFSVHIADEAWIPEDYREAVRFLRDILGPEDSFYTMTSEGTWYYWVNRPSPTRFLVVWFAAPRFYQQEVVEDLEAHKTRIVLYRNDSVMWAPDNVSILERCPIIAEYLETHYRPYRRIGHHEFWIRREE